MAEITAEIFRDIPGLLLLSGLPASGKTTRALEWVAEDPSRRQRLNYDDLRIELYGNDWRFNRTEEAAMKVEATRRVIEWLGAGFSVVIDNTNLTAKVRQHWHTLARAGGFPSVESEIDTPVQVCVERDSKRSGRARVGRTVIDRMALFSGFINWTSPEYGDRPFIVVDLDGTLADCEARRKRAFSTVLVHKPFNGGLCPRSAVQNGDCTVCGGKPKKDWVAFFRDVDADPEIKPVADLVRLLEAHYQLIIVSGRPIDFCGHATEKWLREHYINPVHVFLRNSGDSRSDVIVKQEILELLPKDRIAFVIDDRANVVQQVWRAAGLTCLQAAEGEF